MRTFEHRPRVAPSPRRQAAIRSTNERVELRHFQLVPWRAPDRCPACGERAAADCTCAACGYRPQRALWKRERTDAFDELIDEGKRRVSFALILIAFVTVFAVWALSARGVSGVRLALCGVAVCTLATVFALALAWRDARSFALLSMQWSYSDPVMGVFARGPGPTIEGPPLARYERRLSLTEVHALDDSVTRAIGRGVARRRFCSTRATSNEGSVAPRSHDAANAVVTALRHAKAA